MRRLVFLPLLLVMTLAAHAGTYTLYVSDKTGWSVFDLYAWGDNEAFGKWPGATSASTVTQGGTLFKTYSFSSSLSTIQYNLIFHNNVGEDLPGDKRQYFTLTQPRDYYLEVTNSSVTEIDPPTETTPPQAGSWTVDNTTAISADNRVIYEMNLYDFTSAGTLAAAQQRLSELRQLGIDIIWLMPIYPRGVQGKIGTLGSPYAPRNFTAVNSAHGSLQDLKNFVNAAHGLGMSVWLDWVPNHTGLDHVWVSSHPEYYVWNGNEIAHPNAYSDVYQLNYQNAGLRTAMTNAMLYWVNEADIDGFRCDYISSPSIPLSYWQEAIPALQSNNRNKHVEMLGEADFSSWEASHLLHSGFEYDYAWGYADGLKSVGNGTDMSNARSAAQTMLNNLNNNFNHMSRMAYITNHDDIGDNFSSNYMSVLGSNVAPMTVMYFTFFGMPLLYNGQEIGQTKILNYFNRNTINWNKSQMTYDQLKIHNTIRALIALKHTQPALADGPSGRKASTRLLTTNNTSVIAFQKTKGNNTVLVVISIANQAVNVSLSGVTAGTYNKVVDSQTINSGFTSTPVTLTSSPTISVPAKGYYIYTNLPVTDVPSTGIENQKADVSNHKYIKNGMLFIERAGRLYNAQGLAF